MRRIDRRLAPFRRLAAALALVCATAVGSAQDPGIQTPRQGAQLLRLPKSDDAFGFVVFGDRTGGPADGIQVLEQAVTDTNLLDPDLVMTVGDLVNGYNAKAAWDRQAAEYKGVMQKLRMPWFPVAGNHDIYWRGAGKPAGEHERDFETTFGPLWYAFEHKRCWFVVLYSDEGDPATGEKDFGKPAAQKISDAQFAWLRETLQKAKGARHVFVFLHHPRWITERYPGADWERVHALLAQNGNVTAVFAGHIHRMRYEGVRDGIEYFTVASVGAYLDHDAPQAGYLHEYHVVTVRESGISVAALPVGAVLDPKEFTAEISIDAEKIGEAQWPAIADDLAIADDGAVDSIVSLSFDNPAHRPVELTVLLDGDETWQFAPDHTHVLVPAGQTATASFAVRRAATAAPPVLPRAVVRTEYLAPGRRIALPEKTRPLPAPPPRALRDPDGTPPGVLQLAGKGGDCLRIPSPMLNVPDGPLTLEAWIRADRFDGRRALIAKTESSEYGLFVSDGRLAWMVHLGTAYATAETEDPVLRRGEWHHVAGVFDGRQVRAYLDGRLVARADSQGTRTTNALPLCIGADPKDETSVMSPFCGCIDEVRLSTTARYTGDSFAPARRHEADAATALLLHLDRDAGSWTVDAGPQHAHPLRLGAAACIADPR